MQRTTNSESRLIESDEFPFEFLSQVGDRESWRKEIHRPIYHVHKWWAKRLGSIFRGILLGAELPTTADLQSEFYREHSFDGVTVFDPFMGSGTTVGEAHKLGFTALGRDINPVAYNAVKVAFGPMDRAKLDRSYNDLSVDVGHRIRSLYRTSDAEGTQCDVLYHFWVMQSRCPGCNASVDLFSSYVFASNAYPHRKPATRVLCPACGDVFRGRYGQSDTECPTCQHRFDASRGPARGAKAQCTSCGREFTIQKSIAASCTRPTFRQYAKLVLFPGGNKDYLRATPNDVACFEECSRTLEAAIESQEIRLPQLALADGHNTQQAIGYNFRQWSDFFNDRQLLALGWLRSAIDRISDEAARNWLGTLFSGVLEFNNMFASYKGEGTGAVRHMFSHHILKPERVPIEANVWGTPKSSGAFSTLYRTRLLRAMEYRNFPTEVASSSSRPTVCSPPFSGRVDSWTTSRSFANRAIYLSCGDSAASGLPERSIDLVVTDPPFFDNVHYSELADFFHAWNSNVTESTRSSGEVQDAKASHFAEKLGTVFRECHRVLKDDGLLIFSYHHSRDEGWESVANALIDSRFTVVNCHPVKAEMSVATPKAAAKEPIQLDVILVCRKTGVMDRAQISVEEAEAAANRKMERLERAGFKLSRNDRKVVVAGQLMTFSTQRDVPAEPTSEAGSSDDRAEDRIGAVVGA